MYFLPLICLFVSFVSAENDCSLLNPIVNFYDDLGCSPIHEDGNSCPSHYDCSAFEGRDRSMCRYRNVSYPVNSTIPQNCKFAACFCREGGVFICANVECFDPPVQENCTRIYEEGQCCSSKQYCKGKDAPLPECDYNGESRAEGEVFYPDDHVCKKCKCKKGNGPAECENIYCDTELHSGTSINEGCVPVYYRFKSCCPIEWKCPQADDKITKGSKSSDGKEKCKFGNLLFDQGDELVTDDLKCECQVPPYITCIKKGADGSTVF